MNDPPLLSTDGLSSLLQLANANNPQQLNMAPGLGGMTNNNTGNMMYTQAQNDQGDGLQKMQGYMQQPQQLTSQAPTNGMYQMQDGLSKQTGGTTTMYMSASMPMSQAIAATPQLAQLPPAQQMQQYGNMQLAQQPQQQVVTDRPLQQNMGLAMNSSPNQQQAFTAQPVQGGAQQTYTVMPQGQTVTYVNQGQPLTLQQPQLGYDARGNVVELPAGGQVLTNAMPQQVQPAGKFVGAYGGALQPQTVTFQEPLDGSQGGYRPNVEMQQMQQPVVANPVVIQQPFGQGPGTRPMDPQGANLEPRVAGPIRGTDGSAQLPPNAVPTLYIDNVPADMSQRELAHIFRPFGGFREVRIISKPGRIISFAEFDNAECAAAALSCLNGYLYDPNNQKLGAMQLTFAREQTIAPAKPQYTAQGGQGAGSYNAMPVVRTDVPLRDDGPRGPREHDRRPPPVQREPPPVYVRYGREVEGPGRGGRDGGYGGRGGRDGGYAGRGGRDGVGYGGRAGREGGSYGDRPREDRWQPQRRDGPGRGRGGYM